MPLATSIGADHFAPSCRATQMPTSEFPSRLPPNHAATRPRPDSAIVDAWHWANAACSKMNSVWTIPGCLFGGAGKVEPSPSEPNAAHAASTTNSQIVDSMLMIVVPFKKLTLCGVLCD